MLTASQQIKLSAERNNPIHKAEVVIKNVKLKYQYEPAIGVVQVWSDGFEQVIGTFNTEWQAKQRLENYFRTGK